MKGSGCAIALAASSLRTCADRWSVIGNLLPDASGLTLCMTTVARACRPFWTLFSAAGVHRRRRACSRRGPFLHTHTCSSSRSRLQPRSRILHSTSTSSSTAACGPQVRLAAHPPAPLQRPRPPCYRAHHARPPACPPCTWPAAACSPRRPHQPRDPLVSFLLPATGYICATCVGRRASRVRRWRRRAALQPVDVVCWDRCRCRCACTCRALGHPSMCTVCLFLCSGRDSCVVYRFSSPRCSVSGFYAKEENAFRTQRAEPFIPVTISTGS